MRTIFFIAFALATAIGSNACANHSPPQVPNSFLGTVEQGCTPGNIIAATALLTDPSRCNLPLASGQCNLCKLRLYLPETTTSRFQVQPLFTDLGVANAQHIEATKCKCSEGCYFHQSSITKFGSFPLPNGLTAQGTFSEPLACFSGISSASASNSAYTYLIWCETDGGCPNPVVARYSFVSRFELLSPNRPATKSIFTAKITSLPPTKCLVSEMDERTRKFISGDGTAPVVATVAPTAPKPPRSECSSCNSGRNCSSRICFRKVCVKSLKKEDKANCGIFDSAPSKPSSTCRSEKRTSHCIKKCLAM